MGPRHLMSSSLLAWGLWALFVGITATSVSLSVSGGHPDDAFVGLMLGFATAGALVAAREPRNAVGWLMLAIALTFSLTAWTDGYLLRDGRPMETAVALVSHSVQLVWLWLIALVLPLVFPTGHLLDSRWRAAVWAAAVTILLGVAGVTLKQGPLDVELAGARIENPLGIGGAAGQAVAAGAVLSNVLAAIGLVASGSCLALRLRHSRGREQLQLKWFAYVGALIVTALLLSMVEVFAGESAAGWVVVLGGIGWISALLGILVGIPLAVGVAILKHRLYDIDIVIKGTLVYGALTATLLAIYLGAVLVFRVVLTPLTGESDLAVAASTLGVAALFRPLRARIQALVNRRFYRSRYDASRTLEGFAVHLRDEIDLEALDLDLRRVVADTMQPAHVSLWLREATR